MFDLVSTQFLEGFSGIFRNYCSPCTGVAAAALATASNTVQQLVAATPVQQPKLQLHCVAAWAAALVWQLLGCPNKRMRY